MIFSGFVIETLGARILDSSERWVLQMAGISLLAPSPRAALEALSSLVGLQLPIPGRRGFRRSGDPGLGERRKSNASPEEPDHLVCFVTAGVALGLVSGEAPVCHQPLNKPAFCRPFQELSDVGCRELPEVSRASLLLAVSPRANPAKPPFPVPGKLRSVSTQRTAPRVSCAIDRGFIAIFS